MTEYESISAAELRKGDVVQQTDLDAAYTVQGVRTTDSGETLLRLTDGRKTFETPLVPDDDVRIRARA